MTKEEKADAFDQIVEDAYSLDDKPHRLFLTLLRYVHERPAREALLLLYHNSHKLLDQP